MTVHYARYALAKSLNNFRDGIDSAEEVLAAVENLTREIIAEEHRGALSSAPNCDGARDADSVGTEGTR